MLGKFTLKSGETARISASVDLQFYYNKEKSGYQKRINDDEKAYEKR